MDRDVLVYLNGRYRPAAEAALSVEDRGTLFGDGVYEVLRYYAGRPFGYGAHVERLRRSLEGIRLTPPAEIDRLGEISDEVLRRNGWRDAKVYWQITRGAAPRELAFPSSAAARSVLVMAYPVRAAEPALHPPPLRAVLAEDVRWQRCWIKSLMLLPNVLAHNQAVEAGADVAIFQRDGIVTEATSANLFVVRQGELWTYPADGRILGGVTRAVVLRLAGELGLPVREEAVPVADLFAADEAFLTGTTTHVAPVVEVEGRRIGSGQPGPVTRRLHEAFMRHVVSTCGLDGRS